MIDTEDYYKVLAECDSLRVQLAEATRVPEDAELDALIVDLRSSVDVTDAIGAARGAGIYSNAIDAITALRRRVAGLEQALVDVTDEPVIVTRAARANETSEGET